MLSSPREYKCSLWITSLLPKELSYPSGGKPRAHKICLKQCSPSLRLDCKSILWLQRGSWYYTTVTFSTTTPAKCWESVMLRRMTKLTPMALQFIDLHIPKTFAFIPATQSPGYCNEHFQYFKEEIPHFKKKNLFVSLSHFLFLLMMLFNLIELASPWSPPYHPIVLAPCWWHLPSVPVSVVHRSIIPPPTAPPGLSATPALPGASRMIHPTTYNLCSYSWAAVLCRRKLHTCVNRHHDKFISQALPAPQPFFFPICSWSVPSCISPSSQAPQTCHNSLPHSRQMTAN